MDINETIEVVVYYLSLLKDGRTPGLRIISTPNSIIILDGDTRPDRYTITVDVVGDERYARLLAHKTN